MDMNDEKKAARQRPWERDLHKERVATVKILSCMRLACSKMLSISLKPSFKSLITGCNNMFIFVYLFGSIYIYYLLFVYCLLFP